MALVVNGERIEDSEIQQEIERLRPDYEKAFKDQRLEERETQLFDWSRENVIERVLLNQEAKKYRGQISSNEVESALAEMKKQYRDEEQFYKDFDAENDERVKETVKSILGIERMFQDVCNDLPEPSKDAVLEYYEENKERFKSAERVKVSHIVKHINWRADEEAAYNVIRKAQDELKNGAVFEMLVAKYSDCPENGGDLGYITRGQMVEEFEDVVFNLGVSEESDIFRTRFGFHMAKLYDRKPAVVRSLKEVKSQIAEELEDQMRERAIDEFIDELKNKAEIEEI
jgi:parvulin-like peptidyl-prolyl isomerase